MNGILKGMNVVITCNFVAVTSSASLSSSFKELVFPWLETLDLCCPLNSSPGSVRRSSAVSVHAHVNVYLFECVRVRVHVCVRQCSKEL